MSIRQSIMKLLGFANGGEIPSGRTLIVGENCTDSSIPKAVGTIAPNSQVVGSRTITVNISAAVGDIASKSDVIAAIRLLQRNQRYGGELG